MIVGMSTISEFLNTEKCHIWKVDELTIQKF